MSPGRRPASRGRSSGMWMVATQPGLGQLAAADLGKAGARVEGIETDGRSDLVVFQRPEPPPGAALALAEDLFVLVGEAPAQPSPRALAARLFDPASWLEGANVARAHGIRVGATTGIRVIVRVRSERQFKRTELRAAVVERVLRWRPRWRVRDPADLEIWVLETRRGRFRVAMRISTAEMRSRGGRTIERAGALRPTVAAALVRSAGPPAGLLLDPFCGTGTVLAEARAAGWDAAGSDLDPAAVGAARANNPGVDVRLADAVELPFDDGVAGGVATNAPFGVKHMPRTGGRDLADWWRLVLGELVRVTRPGARLVVLYPEDDVLRAAVRATGSVREQSTTRITTLGRRAAIWVLVRE